MQEKFYLHVANLEALMSDECGSILNAMWSLDQKVCIVMELDKNFDEWDIEKYIHRFKELCLEELVITVSQSRTNQPTYKQVKEVQGALDYFAKYKGYDENEGCQKFLADDVEVFFYSKPF